MPARSMTGFGAASREGAGVSVRAEIRSVNHRGLSVGIRGPGWTEPAHAALEGAVRKRIDRGSVTIHLTVARQRQCAPSRINAEVFADYARQAALAVASTAGPPGGAILPGDLLRLPGVVEDASPAALSAEESAVIEAALAEALDHLVAMREREGAALAAELRGIVASLERAAGSVESLAPAAVAAAGERLRARVNQLLAPGNTLPPEALAREVALLADKSDVAEEVARLRSHVAQWRDALDAGVPVGRRLDFLAQEFGREVNTIGSKSQDAALAALVVEMKVCVERLKEQAANIE